MQLQLKLVHQMHLFLAISDLAMMAHTLVSSQMGYYNRVHMELPLKCVWKLQLVQNNAARLLIRANHMGNTTSSLQKCHQLLVHFHVQLKVLIMTLKTLYNLGPGYLK